MQISSMFVLLLVLCLTEMASANLKPGAGCNGKLKCPISNCLECRRSDPNYFGSIWLDCTTCIKCGPCYKPGYQSCEACKDLFGASSCRYWKATIPNMCRQSTYTGGCARTCGVGACAACPEHHDKETGPRRCDSFTHGDVTASKKHTGVVIGSKEACGKYCVNQWKTNKKIDGAEYSYCSQDLCDKVKRCRCLEGMKENYSGNTNYWTCPMKGVEVPGGDSEEESGSVTMGPVTTGGNAGGERCVFPFTGYGTKYEACTNLGKNGKIYGYYWCATTSSYDTDGKWGKCPDPVQTTGGNADEANCFFPFIGYGTKYEACTNLGKNGKVYGYYWCATTSSYDRDGKWGKCPDPE